MGQVKYYHPEIEKMSRRALRDLQNERLRWQIHRCLAKSQFYREKFQKAGIKATLVPGSHPWGSARDGF